MVAKGLKVCKPVTSTPNAKFPLPTCNGVDSELALRNGLDFLTTCSLSILLSTTITAVRSMSSPAESSMVPVLVVQWDRKSSAGSRPLERFIRRESAIYCYAGSFGLEGDLGASMTRE